MARLIQFLILIACFAPGVKADVNFLRVSGLAVDIYTGANIPGVSFYTVLDSKRKLLCQGDEKGQFDFDLPKDCQMLFVEKAGFRSASTPINILRQESRSPVFFIRFPLIPLDKQVLNSPYMQSEQEQYILKDSISAAKFVMKTFRISDAISGNKIDLASICFKYTRKDKTDCKEITPANPELELKFTEGDIVGFTIQAPGYQNYTGNLILEKIDGKHTRYDIQLSPQINMLALYLSGQSEIKAASVTPLNGKELKLSKFRDNAWCAVLNDGNYSLQLFRANGLMVHAEKVALKKGLNFVEVANFERKAPPVTKPVPKAELAKPETKSDTAQFNAYETVTVYFKQSDYILIPEEKNKLDALAARLKAAESQKVRIVGHTDNVGNPKLNVALSEFRARVIRNYLMTKSVSEKRISYTGVGGKFPAKRNDSEENKKMNRRVEITMLPRF